jgi:hypothetical protein
MTELQVFFSTPVGAVTVPVAETLLPTADQVERSEHVGLVTTDAGFMHSQEQYPR